MTKIAFSTLGCKVNQYDTSAIQSSLAGMDDYTVVPFHEEADIYLINTCTVTGKGDVESRQLVRKAFRNNSSARIIVTGCYAQTNPEDIAKIAGVSMVLGNEEKFTLSDYLEHSGDGALEGKIIVGDISKISVMQRPGPAHFSTRTRAFLKIQDGCDSRCSYCIVPFSRGHSRSLPPEDVINQLTLLHQYGYKEVILCGVHLGGYGRDLFPAVSLSYLLRRILSCTDIMRIRLSSIEPGEITDELIDIVASEKRLCRHFHIPLQSGDEYILRRMNRNYTAAFYEDLISSIKVKIPDAGIGCDVMVGYPGEEEHHLYNTCRLIERLPVTYLHVFAYSPRHGTAAYHVKETVKGDVKRDRSDLIRALGEKKRLDFMNRYIGEEVDVLVEEDRDEKTGFFKGYTGNYLRVMIATGSTASDSEKDQASRISEGEREDSTLINKIVGVHISGLLNGNLFSNTGFSPG